MTKPAWKTLLGFLSERTVGQKGHYCPGLRSV
jgi:hypothetical protein